MVTHVHGVGPSEEGLEEGCYVHLLWVRSLSHRHSGSPSVGGLKTACHSSEGQARSRNRRMVEAQQILAIITQ